MADRFFADNPRNSNAIQYMQAITNPDNSMLREGRSFWDYDKPDFDASIDYAISDKVGGERRPGVSDEEKKKSDALLRQILVGMFREQYPTARPKINERGSAFGNPEIQRLMREAGI